MAELEVERRKLAALRKVLIPYNWPPKGVEANRDGAVHNDVSVHTGGESECCLCLDAYHAGVGVVQLQCGHVFHHSCAFRWLVEAQAFKARTCPLCKANPLATQSRAAQKRMARRAITLEVLELPELDADASPPPDAGGVAEGGDGLLGPEAGAEALAGEAPSVAHTDETQHRRLQMPEHV